MKSMEKFFASLTPKKMMQYVVLIIVILVGYFGRQWWAMKGDTIHTLAPNLEAQTISVSIDCYAPESDGPAHRDYELDLYGEKGQTLMEVVTNLHFHDFPASMLPRKDSAELKEADSEYIISFADDNGDFLALRYLPGHWFYSLTDTEITSFRPVSVPQGVELGDALGVLLWLYGES